MEIRQREDRVKERGRGGAVAGVDVVVVSTPVGEVIPVEEAAGFGEEGCRCRGG